MTRILDAIRSPDCNHPDREEELSLIRRAQGGDERAREEFLTRNLRLVVKLAKRYHPRTLDLEDLVMEGVFGMNRALEKFDTTRGHKFSTYADQWIRQSIVRAIDNQDEAIRKPAHQMLKVRSLRRQDEPVRIEDLDESTRAAYLADAPPAASHEFWSRVADKPEQSSEEQALNQETRREIEECLHRLPYRQQTVISKLYGFNDRTWGARELSIKLGVSTARIHQIKRKALENLRPALTRSLGVHHS